MVRGGVVEQKKMYERRRGERTLHTDQSTKQLRHLIQTYEA